jgi:rRNA-processing protein FCF1
MKFLLDTNFLLAPGKHKVDVFRELERFGKPELYTIDLVVKELEKLSRGKGKDGSHARLALELLEKKKIRVLDTGGTSADLEIERIASEEGFAVCTQDRELRERLSREDVIVIFLRQKRILAKM